MLPRAGFQVMLLAMTLLGGLCSPCVSVEGAIDYLSPHLQIPVIQRTVQRLVSHHIVLVENVGFVFSSVEDARIAREQRTVRDILQAYQQDTLRINYLIVTRTQYRRVSDEWFAGIRELSRKRLYARMLIVPEDRGLPNVDFARRLIKEAMNGEYTNKNLREIIEFHARLTAEGKTLRRKILEGRLQFFIQAFQEAAEFPRELLLYDSLLRVKKFQSHEELRLLTAGAEEALYWHGFPLEHLTENIKRGKRVQETTERGIFFGADLMYAALFHKQVILGFTRKVVGNNFYWDGQLRAMDDVDMAGALRYIVFDSESNYHEFQKKISDGLIRPLGEVVVCVRNESGELYVPSPYVSISQARKTRWLVSGFKKLIQLFSPESRATAAIEESL